MHFQWFREKFMKDHDDDDEEQPSAGHMGDLERIANPAIDTGFNPAIANTQLRDMFRLLNLHQFLPRLRQNGPFDWTAAEFLGEKVPAVGNSWEVYRDRFAAAIIPLEWYAELCRESDGGEIFNVPLANAPKKPKRGTPKTSGNTRFADCTKFLLTLLILHGERVDSPIEQLRQAVMPAVASSSRSFTPTRAFPDLSIAEPGQEGKQKQATYQYVTNHFSHLVRNKEPITIEKISSKTIAEVANSHKIEEKTLKKWLFQGKTVSNVLFADEQGLVSRIVSGEGDEKKQKMLLTTRMGVTGKNTVEEGKNSSSNSGSGSSSHC
jgi:hypothetical protein